MQLAGHTMSTGDRSHSFLEQFSSIKMMKGKPPFPMRRIGIWGTESPMNLLGRETLDVHGHISLLQALHMSFASLQGKEYRRLAPDCFQTIFAHLFPLLILLYILWQKKSQP